MTDTKDQQPSTSSSAMEDDKSKSTEGSAAIERLVSTENRQAARRFFSAYAQTWIGLSPIWLMGEALTPGAKLGSKFKQGSSQLKAAVNDIRLAVSTSSQDVIVIIDEKLEHGKSETNRAAEVIKAAGSVHSSSLILPIK
jgi:hypothetical protein